MSSDLQMRFMPFQSLVTGKPESVFWVSFVRWTWDVLCTNQIFLAEHKYHDSISNACEFVDSMTAGSSSHPWELPTIR